MATPGFASIQLPFSSRTGMQRPAWTNPSSSVAAPYNAAIHTQAGDYDKIMGNYGNLFNTAQTQANKGNISAPSIQLQQRTFTPSNPYQRSAGFEDVANRLTDMSNTGGYSSDDITAFRSRGLAPIRSIYSSALENLKRQRAIQGGYSPNYGAMAAKLAREQSGIIGQKTMDLNANIAERVAQGKQFALGQLTPTMARESEFMNEFNRANTTEANRINEANVNDANQAAILNANFGLDTDKFNATNINNSLNQALAANQGAANLYGTTPALVNTFGNQMLQSNAQNLAGQQAESVVRQNRANTGLDLLRLGATRRLGA